MKAIVFEQWDQVLGIGILRRKHSSYADGLSKFPDVQTNNKRIPEICRW